MNTLEQLQKEALEKWRVYPAYLSVEPLLNELVAKVFLAGEKEENKAWLNGYRCDNCGDAKEYQATSSMCNKCWEEG